MAEDDPDIQLVARLALKKAGFRVEVVDNGRILLERVRVERPDLVLLDWMMPEMNGPETCAQLKANNETRDIPIIFMTSKTQSTAGERGVEGAAGYIVKPFNPQSLGDEIRRILEIRP